ncbi:glycosyltransferase [Georgenia satyanarayanai]|uniref:glycosyltransferase n=1 Tax=Georgenia satyanarayanai TaxID=860221 RepID=UPI0012648E31|nr:glycosyltransferase [Georgenia satyanarayanai]
MAVKAWMRRLPPIAQRDAQIHELRRAAKQREQKADELREQRRALLEDVRRLQDARGELRRENRELRESARRPRPGWIPPSRARAVRLVQESGLFDPDWYLAQLEPAARTDAAADPAAHLVDHGDARGLSPHPAFVPGHYASQPARTAKEQVQVARRPFLHYLDLGAEAGRSPHPLFDAASYLAGHPESGTAPGGPLAHFLSAGRALGSSDGATGEPWDQPAELLAAARAAAQVLLDTRGFEHVERDRASFDTELEARVKAELRSRPLPPDPPTVSVVVPTKDRAHLLGATIDSVLAQTYPHWQLVVVDDGSEDDTPALLERYASDERIEVVRHDVNRGVAAAHNSGVQRATGRYVAYLGSDNTWVPDFLELMVRHLVHSGDRVAYAVTALVEQGGEGRRLYRGLPFNRAHLRERNYIDGIVFVHERSLIDEVGGFDESLRRYVDWDLLVRLAERTDFTFLPIIATEYDVWTEEGERITTHEPMAYRYAVLHKTLVDLDAVVRDAPARDEELLSVVVTVPRTATADTVLTSVRRLLATADGPVEVVVVDATSEPGVFVELHARLGAHPEVVLVRLSQPLPMELARNAGLGRTRGRDVVFLHHGLWTEPGWDAPLREALRVHAVAQPLVLSPGGEVWSAGVEYLASGDWYLPWSGFGGDAPELRGEREVAAVSAAAVAVRGADVAAAGGFDPLVRDDIYGGELSARVRQVTGRSAVCVPSSRVAWLRPVTDSTTETGLRRARDNQRRERELLLEAGRPASDPATTLPGYRLVGFDRARNTQVAPRPLLVHDRPERPLRWAIKIGAPTVERRTNWGDWHFAESLRDSLERLGHEVSIDCKDSWYRPTSHLDDVVLQLRGVATYEANPGHTNVAWVISHPDRVSAGELAGYDLAFGASPRWCHTMGRRLGRPVEPLLQCTDQHRFHPVEPDRHRAHDVLVVANARGVRPSVAAALQAGIVPAVYGLRWDGQLPDGAWKGTYIPNAELPAVYSAAGVVLNDHWDDMRDMGLLSNRLFDLAACDARVVSDDLPEIADVFGDVVLTYGGERDIATAIRSQLSETPERAEARRELGVRVRGEHTFDARAARLTEAVAELRARRGVPVAR